MPIITYDDLSTTGQKISDMYDEFFGGYREWDAYLIMEIEDCTAEEIEELYEQGELSAGQADCALAIIQ